MSPMTGLMNGNFTDIIMFYNHVSMFHFQTCYCTVSVVLGLLYKMNKIKHLVDSTVFCFYDILTTYTVVSMTT